MTREEAIEKLVNATIEPPWGGSFSATSEALDMAIEALQTPPISQRSMYQAGYRQAQEDRPKGKWIKDICKYDKAYHFKCSICDEWNGLSVEEWNWKPNFCPNCGADMRGEDE